MTSILDSCFALFGGLAWSLSLGIVLYSDIINCTDFFPYFNATNALWQKSFVVEKGAPLYCPVSYMWLLPIQPISWLLSILWLLCAMLYPTQLFYWLELNTIIFTDIKFWFSDFALPGGPPPSKRKRQQLPDVAPKSSPNSQRCGPSRTLLGVGQLVLEPNNRTCSL